MWMRSTGLEAAVKSLQGQRFRCLRICGGYQIIGNTITDKEGAERKLETPNTQVRGMELLPIDTNLKPKSPYQSGRDF